jgi:hypothetical protein
MSKNNIDIEYAMCTFSDNGFEAVVFNSYQIRIRIPNQEKFFDWYHTTGTITIISNGSTAKVATIGEPDSVVNFINKYLKK